MRYFFDTEFWERGHQHPILFISLGIVAADGREFYAENADVDLSTLSPWLQENVVPYLRKEGALVLPHKEIGPAVLKFLDMDARPEFWAYFADYDWVIFCQLFGSMIELPPTFPHFCRDLQQEKWRIGCEKPTIEGCGPAHNALADARWNRAFFNWLVEKKGLVLPAPLEVKKVQPVSKPLREGWKGETKSCGHIGEVAHCEVCRAVKPKTTVHLLHAGLPVCRFNLNPPSDWPADHKWAARMDQLKTLDSRIEMPCMECVRQVHLQQQRVP